MTPELVAEVTFTEWTEAGTLRYLSFQGLRKDKRAREVVWAPAHQSLGFLIASFLTSTDGRMGPKTRAALKAFQEANGLKGTGQLDNQTAEKLGIAKGATPMGKEMKAMKKEKMEPMSKEPMSKEK